jgi:hypothetical protein
VKDKGIDENGREEGGVSTGKRPDADHQAARQEIANRFKEAEKTDFCREAERILKYYVLYSHQGLPPILDYLEKIRKTRTQGLGNDEVDRLINEILDDEMGYYAFKLNLVRETVDGVEVNVRQEDVVIRFLQFLKREGLSR